VTPLRQRMLEDLQIRRYSPTTIRLYLRAVAEFARHFGKPPDQLGAEHIRLYQLFLVKEKKVALPSYIQMVCALRFFYTQTLNQKVAIDRIPFPRGREEAAVDPEPRGSESAAGGLAQSSPSHPAGDPPPPMGG